jgi:dihydrofolate reductase
MISMISAVAENRIIGNKNTLPWHMPADFKYFKEATTGKTLVMGLNTFNSIGGKPLPGRKHVILSNDPNFVAPASPQGGPENCVVAHSIEEALKIVNEPDPTSPEGSAGQEVMVCGGASIYKQFLPLAQRLYITEIHASPEGDTYFPEVNLQEWNEVKRTDFKADEKNMYDYSFVILERK